MQFYGWRLIQLGVALYLVAGSCHLLGLTRNFTLFLIVVMGVGFAHAVGPVITFDDDEES